MKIPAEGRDLPLSPMDPLGQIYIRNIALDIILTLMTCGLWNLRVQFVQMAAINAIMGIRKYTFWKWLGLSLITCGLYHIYHEYIKSMDISTYIKKSKDEPILEIILIVFGLAIVADAIQQSQINTFFGSKSVL